MLLQIGISDNEILSDIFRFQIGISDGKSIPFRLRYFPIPIGISDFFQFRFRTLGSAAKSPLSGLPQLGFDFWCT